ncbi:uncharacterized protein LOC126619340 [Malus sylvestris]|uniref:uncharacterized protein LOC126619340 n=1 Tax=Malus sylvestris TaxID=3752 RepID=UPI0021AC9C67|nr:uncharacterized protein LOC126619340 [Malus sylvestris]
MAPTKKYSSGYLKHQRKRKVEQLITSKKGAIDRFFLKEKEPQSSVDDLITEQQDDNEKLVDDLGNDEIDDDLDENDNHEDAPIVTDQPKRGRARDLSIEKGPQDQFNRRFNAAFYTRYLSN